MLPLACGGAEQEAKSPDAADEREGRERSTREPGRQRSLDDHRRAFMDGCLARVPRGADFCECGWEQLKETFSEDEMNSDSKPDASKLRDLRERTAETCQSKLPESVLREDFVNDCAGGKPDLVPFCSCAWTELRKKLSVADFADKETMQSRRFLEAKKGVSSKCGAKMPEHAIREEFMRGCLQVDVQATSFCSCVWKTLRTKMSHAEIAAADAAELQAHEHRVKKACGTVRGKK